MKVNLLRFLSALTFIILLSCTSTRSTGDKSVKGATAPRNDVKPTAIQGSVTAQKKEKFWPIYNEFEFELSKIRIKRIELVLKFIRNHENLSDAEAMAMLKQKWGLDSDELKLKQAYADKFMKVFPGRKVVRFYQAENKFDTAAIAELYGNAPMIR
jgi:hypothetical protein